MILIREALPNEKDIILKILTKAQLSLSYIDNNSNDVHMVVESDGSIVGTGNLEIYENIAMIKYVYIIPEYRGQRLGDGLVRAMINFVDRRHVKKIYLSNKESVAYFRKFGFEYINDFEATALKQCDPLQEITRYTMGLDIDEFFNNHKCQ